jgi:four helix bundle protein
MFNFEKLAVWRRSVAFAGMVYRCTKDFPGDERFGLTNQLRRAANSIPSNLAEGAARSAGDNARFIGYAAGSLYEVVTQATIARNEGFLEMARSRHSIAKPRKSRVC